MICSVCGSVLSRLTAAKRGYGKKWQKYRDRFLIEKMYLCERCLKNGDRREATVVHHIIPVTSRDDPLFWQPENHMALCRTCHEVMHGRKKDENSRT
jgi:5-methylcytosine-specific restriction enzyme A